MKVIDNTWALVKFVRDALANSDQWQTSTQPSIVASDPAGLIEVRLDTSQYRFSEVRVLGSSLTVEQTAQATRLACNRALDLSDDAYNKTADQLGLGQGSEVAKKLSATMDKTRS